MGEEKTLDEALDEMDYWTDRVSETINSLSSEEVAEYFRRAQLRVEQRLGKPLNLPVRKAPRVTPAD
jgi:hypothetical protein